ncbi:UDP-N-acetylglucosamine 1-carboxyvinyltransferase [Ornithinibacillus salinisoli]|uniref:UDP-N-acetylglucosamine 1-carboxyvinyltransferase n=1 Tax=Ornithinibacillus salinisoli TaxID=1848459 RepID=A0ABW4W330_9BACI
MKWLEVNKSGPLNGSVSITGSKNSALALLSATLLSDEVVTLNQIPNIEDMRVICEIFNELGATSSWEDDKLVIDPTNIYTGVIDPMKSSSYRASYYLVGALLQKMKKIRIGYPGGDNFLSRPIDQHIKGWQALGAKVTLLENEYIVEADRLVGADIYFDTITSGATMNMMMTAVLADGKTTLKNTAKDPEVVDLANLLNTMGANVIGAGTSQIIIHGVKELSGCTYRVIPDRLVAGSFLMSVGLNGGTITVNNVIPEHLRSCIAKLTETGIEIYEEGSSITAIGGENLKAIRIRTGMYPQFPTDLQQPFTSLLLNANGRSIITEKVYPHRYSHIQQLLQMGANIKTRQGTAFIQGKSKLSGSLVKATDVRAGICLIMAGMIAEGTTIITGLNHIERGYENIVSLYQSLGANIEFYEGKYLFDKRLEQLSDLGQ